MKIQAWNTKEMHTLGKQANVKTEDWNQNKGF